MISDVVIRSEGMKALRDNPGIIEAERFITLIRKEPFNYTEWQRDLWKDQNVDEIFNKARDFHDKKSK